MNVSNPFGTIEMFALVHGCFLPSNIAEKIRRTGVKIAKFNSFYYYGLIPEITNKERYAQQSHQTNDNEYHKKDEEA